MPVGAVGLVIENTLAVSAVGLVIENTLAVSAVVVALSLLTEAREKSKGCDLCTPFSNQLHLIQSVAVIINFSLESNCAVQLFIYDESIEAACNEQRLVDNSTQLCTHTVSKASNLLTPVNTTMLIQRQQTCRQGLLKTIF